MNSVVTPERDPGMVKPYRTEQSPELFPFLRPFKQKVAPGDYRICIGNDVPIYFKNDRFKRLTNKDVPPTDVYPGVRFHGYYDSEGRKDPEAPGNWVVSFLYHKLKDGRLETEESVIVLRGVGFGVHPDHYGQGESEYLRGIDIGQYDPDTGVMTLEVDKSLEQKSFSVACIADGPYGGEPVLANPVK
jgi:hypothetical protein